MKIYKFNVLNDLRIFILGVLKMKRIILYLLILLSGLVMSGCAVVWYPDEYWGWPEERRVVWREEHPLRFGERYGTRHERFEGERREERERR